MASISDKVIRQCDFLILKIESILYAWIIDHIIKGVFLSRNVIKIKATFKYNVINLKEAGTSHYIFSASTDWLEG